MSVSLSSSKLFAANIVKALVGFVAIAVFARELGAAALGTFFLFQALLRVFEVGIDLGLNTAMEKRLSEGITRAQFLGSGIALKAAGFVLLAPLLWVFRAAIDGYVGQSVTLFLIVALGLSQAGSVVTSTLRGELRVGDTAVLYLSNQLVYVVVGLILISVGLGVTGLIWGVVAGGVVVVVWGVLKLNTRPALPTRETVMSLLSYTKFNIIPTLGLQVHNWLDIIVIGFILTQADVGAYEVSWRIAAVALLLPTALGIALLPQASALSASKDTEHIGRLTSDSLIPSVTIAIPAAFGTLVLGQSILRHGFGAEYVFAYPALVILVAGKIPESIQFVIGRVLLGIDRPDKVARATVVAAVLNLVLNVALVPIYGLVGAAVATTLSYSVGMLMRWTYLKREIPLQFPLGQIARITAVSAVMAAALFGIDQVVSSSGLFVLVLLVLVGMLTFALGFIAVPSLREVALKFVEEIRG